MRANQVVVELLAQITVEKNAAPAQIALAWWIVPIPGSRKIERLDKNNGAINILIERRRAQCNRTSKCLPKLWLATPIRQLVIILERNSTMEIKRVGSRPSGKGPVDYFTGTVRIDPLFEAADPARARGANVTFEPGARTAWHTHPLGQTLIVTAGCGWAQRAGGPIEEIRPGDVVWFPPGEKHWHGAAPTTAMTHIAIQEALDGNVVEWMEKVGDADYERGPAAR